MNKGLGLGETEFLNRLADFLQGCIKAGDDPARR